MPKLLDLSAELILCIAANLLQASLLKVALVCKALRSITTPELYREFTQSEPNRTPSSRFAHVIVRHQELTKYVQTVALER